MLYWSALLEASGELGTTTWSLLIAYEMCLLCHQQLVNQNTIVSNFVWVGLKFRTAMFHQSNCLWMAYIRNVREIKLRYILIRNDRFLTKSTARFGQFTTTFCRTAHNKPSPKDPNDRFFSPQSSRLSTLLFVSTRNLPQPTALQQYQMLKEHQLITIGS